MAGEKNRIYFPKPCVWCGKKYTPRSKTHRHCSMECSAKNLGREQRAKAMKRCAQCERMFYNRNSNAKYCNQDCYYEAARSRRVKNYMGIKLEQVQCPHCTAFFTQRSINHKFCTRSCYKASKKHQTYLRLKATSRTDCKECGTPLTVLGRVFCSVTCRTKHYLVGKRVYTKTCLMCAVEFKTYNNGRQHCSKTCSNRSSNRKKQHEAALRNKAYQKHQELRETMERRVKESKMMPLETAHGDAIKAFLQRGGTIKQYQPQDADDSNLAVPSDYWSYDQYDAEI